MIHSPRATPSVNKSHISSLPQNNLYIFGTQRSHEINVDMRGGGGGREAGGKDGLLELSE